MKRFVLFTCLCSLLGGTIAQSALGFQSNQFDYEGHVKGQQGAFVGFAVKSTAGQRKRIAHFTVAVIPYSCTDAPSGTTAGWRFDDSIRMEPDRTFGGSGDWIGQPLDPVGRVGGKLRKGGVAVGDFKLRGELAGPGTHCTTGLLDWRATKQPPAV
jgi:hypothetical protein